MNKLPSAIGPVEQRRKRGDAPVHLGEVSVVTAGLRRCARADEVHVAERRGPRVGRREGQSPGVQLASKEFPEFRLVNGQLPGVQLLYLPGVCVDAEHVESEAGHAGGMRDAQVPGPQHSQP
jgi:hypothetical protein